MANGRARTKALRQMEWGGQDRWWTIHMLGETTLCGLSCIWCCPVMSGGHLAFGHWGERVLEGMAAGITWPLSSVFPSLSSFANLLFQGQALEFLSLPGCSLVQTFGDVQGRGTSFASTYLTLPGWAHGSALWALLRRALRNPFLSWMWI